MEFVSLPHRHPLRVQFRQFFQRAPLRPYQRWLLRLLRQVGRLPLRATINEKAKQRRTSIVVAMLVLNALLEKSAILERIVRARYVSLLGAILPLRPRLLPPPHLRHRLLRHRRSPHSCPQLHPLRPPLLGRAMMACITAWKQIWIAEVTNAPHVMQAKRAKVHWIASARYAQTIFVFELDVSCF